ncbi:efflux RND transporter periplasmic adaptor subunit [Azospirillum sp. TSO22-1]|uniref:efflux RND transporter periplasmic adaptor subunit n=1 Tax=Azospirillum sp. TSO22-1 TaxID=716789 RepID=UPI001FFFA9B2|nr:efflux RND transporter periplasmic adaptor subunit [Azospirillum sp. TSO22-1]
MLLLVAALAAGGYWYTQMAPEAGATAAKAGSGGKPSIPVVLQAAAVKAVPEDLSTIGTVQPIATIAIKARVDNTVVDTVHFTEGQEVAAGDLLFSLDDRALKAQLRVAEANLERDRANFEKARGDVVRYGELLRSAVAARQQYDAAVAAANALEGTVKADLAAIESAKVSLSYTRIYAPMAGRTGTVNAKLGTMVRAADANPLVTITQLRPINVAFNVAERSLPAIRAALAAGKLKVTAGIPGGKGPRAEGELTFVDSQVDQQSGTILVRATFANADTLLWPGQFVDTVLTLRVEPQALTVPAVAVQTGQEGRFVYVAKPDNTVDMRTVTVARTYGDLAIIGSGLTAGERVVVDGQSRLFPGAPVAERGPSDNKGGDTKGGAKTGNADPAKPTQSGGQS